MWKGINAVVWAGILFLNTLPGSTQPAFIQSNWLPVPSSEGKADFSFKFRPFDFTRNALFLIPDMWVRLNSLEAEMLRKRACPVAIITGKVFNDKCIELVTTKRTFTAAAADCIARGGKLFEPDINDDSLYGLLDIFPDLIKDPKAYVGIWAPTENMDPLYLSTYSPIRIPNPRTPNPTIGVPLYMYMLFYYPIGDNGDKWVLDGETVRDNPPHQYFCEYSAFGN